MRARTRELLAFAVALPMAFMVPLTSVMVHLGHYFTAVLLVCAIVACGLACGKIYELECKE